MADPIDPGPGDLGSPDPNDPITIDKWRESLPEDLATDPAMEPIKDLAGLAKSYIHAQKMVGADKVAIPGEKATEEDWAAFWAKIGRPDEDTGYDEIGPPDEAPEGFQHNQEFEDAFKKMSHESNLTKRQANDMWKKLQKLSIDGFEGRKKVYTESMMEAENTLRKEFGQAYDEKIKAIDGLAYKLGGNDLLKIVQSDNFRATPLLMQAFAKLSKDIGEDKLGPGRTTPTLTPIEAKTKINKIKGDSKHPYHDPKNPAHKAAVEDMEKLYQAAYPEPEK